MNYLKNNIDKGGAIKIISEKIKLGEPFLFTRFGDGEVWLLKKEVNSTRINRIIKEWGVNKANYTHFVDKINKDLIESFNESDLIGLMGDNYNDYGIPGLPIEEWRITLNLCDKLGLKTNGNITDHLLCRSNELGNVHNFAKILNKKPLHIISPNTEILKSKGIDKILDCDITYTKIERNPNTVIHNREELIKRLSNVKENVVIFGTGAGGKFIGTYLKKNHNKICLDFGSTLDAWANIISRGWFNTTQKHLKII